MENSEEQDFQESNPPTPLDLNKLLGSGEIQNAIPRLVDIFEKTIDVKEATAKRMNSRFLIIALTLFITVVISVTWLTLEDGISSEATAFLLGVIITGAISIIRDFTGGR